MADSSRKRLAIIGATGKLASATLKAIIEHKLLPAQEIVATTSATSRSSRQWQSLDAQGVLVRHATFDDASTIEAALKDVDKVFIVSSPRIELDYHDAPVGQGREKDHIAAIDAARRAGVNHIYYTSLAFARPSKASVMRAHILTEEYLEREVTDVPWTVIREGLYSESWPLYLGHWRLGEDERSEVLVAGDGKLSWTSIADLGVATALVLTAPSGEHARRTLYLSSKENILTLRDIAALVSEKLGRKITVKVVSRSEHEDYYIRQRGEDEGHIRWWASTYDAVNDGEADIQDDLQDTLLRSRGLAPEPFAETLKGMIK